ncbi:MAG: AAA family ATPase [Acidobacteriota bacterium]
MRPDPPCMPVLDRLRQAPGIAGVPATHEKATPGLQREPGRQPEVWVIGGGKGGTGKTLMCANLAMHLAHLGDRVVAVDADLGCPNLHTALGLECPERTLSDFINRRWANLEEVALPTGTTNLRVISGARNALNSESLPFLQKQRFIRQLRQLDADRVLVDLGAGISLAVLDLFCSADRPVAVVLPEPTSVENLYRFLKASFFRRIAKAAREHGIGSILDWVGRRRKLSGLVRPADLVNEVERVDGVAGRWIRSALERFRPSLIINQSRHRVDDQLGESIEVACRTFLGVPLQYVGSVPYDACFGAALRSGYPYLKVHYTQTAASRIMRIGKSLRDLSTVGEAA